MALAREISGLASRARSKRLTMDDISGGTFTITNAGGFGTFITVPVINQPQVAILSTDGVRKRPVVVELPDGSDGIAIHPVGNLVMSWDHRAVDGAYAAAFMAKVRQVLRDPRLGGRALSQSVTLERRSAQGGLPCYAVSGPTSAARVCGADVVASPAVEPARLSGGAPLHGEALVLAPGRTLRLRWLGGRVAYRDAHALQRALWAAGPAADDWLLLLEHPHVYTAGIRAKPEHMLVDPAAVGAELLWVDRGGDITYHGPGQLVGYPVLSVPSGPSATPRYVHEVEQFVIDALAGVGLTNVGRLDGYPGVWVDPGGPDPGRSAPSGRVTAASARCTASL